jgi:hypothetical protein
MSNEDEYARHRRRLREERELEPVDDAEEITVVDLAGGGFITNFGVCMFVVGGDSEPEAGSDTWGMTAEERHRPRKEGQ